MGAHGRSSSSPLAPRSERIGDPFAHRLHQQHLDIVAQRPVVAVGKEIQRAPQILMDSDAHTTLFPALLAVRFLLLHHDDLESLKMAADKRLLGPTVAHRSGGIGPSRTVMSSIESLLEDLETVKSPPLRSLAAAPIIDEWLFHTNSDEVWIVGTVNGEPVKSQPITAIDKEYQWAKTDDSVLAARFATFRGGGRCRIP